MMPMLLSQITRKCFVSVVVAYTKFALLLVCFPGLWEQDTDLISLAVLILILKTSGQHVLFEIFRDPEFSQLYYSTCYWILTTQ